MSYNITGLDGGWGSFGDALSQTPPLTLQSESSPEQPSSRSRLTEKAESLRKKLFQLSSSQEKDSSVAPQASPQSPKQSPTRDSSIRRSPKRDASKGQRQLARSQDGMSIFPSSSSGTTGSSPTYSPKKITSAPGSPRKVQCVGASGDENPSVQIMRSPQWTGRTPPQSPRRVAPKSPHNAYGLVRSPERAKQQVQEAPEGSFELPPLPRSPQRMATFSEEKAEETFDAVVKVPFQLQGLPHEMVPQTALRKKNGQVISEELKFPLLFFGKVPASLEERFVNGMKTIDLGTASTTIIPTVNEFKGRFLLSWSSEDPFPFDEARQRVFSAATHLLQIGQEAEPKPISMSTFLHNLVQTGHLPSVLPPSVQRLSALTLTIHGLASAHFFHKKTDVKIKKKDIQPLAQVAAPLFVVPVAKKDRLMSVDVSLSLSPMSKEQALFFERLCAGCARHENIEVARQMDLHISLCIVEGVSRDVARRIEKSVQGLMGQSTVRAIPAPKNSLSIIGRSHNFAVVDLEGDAPLIELCQKVRDIVFQLSGLRDHFPFAPHVSVARSKAPEGFRHDFVEEIPPPPPEFIFEQRHLVVNMRTVTMARLVRRGEASVPAAAALSYDEEPCYEPPALSTSPRPEREDPVAYVAMQ